MNTNDTAATDLKLTWEKDFCEANTWAAEIPGVGIVTIERAKACRSAWERFATDRTSPWSWTLSLRYSGSKPRVEMFHRSIPQGTNLRDAKKIATAIVAEAIRLGR